MRVEVVINGRIREFITKGNLVAEVFSNSQGGWNRLENPTEERIIAHYTK